jgi:serine/threonine-protein kinase HipA
MTLARLAGVRAASAKLIDSAGTPVTLVMRFDRTESGQRIPYASAATLLGVDPGEAAEHSYTELVDASGATAPTPKRTSRSCGDESRSPSSSPMSMTTC